jgi:hypothetical protein
MRNQSGKSKQSQRRRQGPAGRSTNNRRDQNRKSLGSNFGDDEIGGTSFDPRPVHSEASERDERTAKKASGTPAGTDNKK